MESASSVKCFQADIEVGYRGGDARPRIVFRHAIFSVLGTKKLLLNNHCYCSVRHSHKAFRGTISIIDNKMMRVDDLVIMLAYFSIPIQILVSLWHYPRLGSMPRPILLLLILFALFIFLCGTGHFLRCMGKTGDTVYAVLNTLTAIISSITAVYLLPLIPSLMSSLDENIQTLTKLNADTAESKRKLLTFMAFLCHEIRNPLFAITSTLAFLEDDHEVLTLEQSRAFASINQSTRLMLRLVNDVLNLRKIESGQLELEAQRFDVYELLQHVAASTEMHVKELHADRGGDDAPVEFSFTLEPTVPRNICGDSVRLLQIVYNLLSNATKFTEQGSIGFTVSTVDYKEAVDTGLIPTPMPTLRELHETVTLDAVAMGSRDSTIMHKLLHQLSAVVGVGRSSGSKATAHTDGSEANDNEMGLLQAEEGLWPGVNGSPLDPDDDEYDVVVLKFEVSDTGPGISQERMEYIFEPYTQSKLSEYRKHGGTGLGLSILLGLLRQMGGDICAVSEVGVGTTFVAYLPVAVPKRSVPGPKAETVVDKARLSDLLAMSSSLEHYRTDHQYGTMTGGHKKYSRDGGGMVSTSMRHTSAPPIHEPSNGLTLVSPMEVSVKIPQKKLLKLELSPNDSVVLVVDDNLINLRLIGRMLEHFNVEYRLACNGQEAVDMVLQSRNMNPSDSSAPFYSLILMDLNMPVLGGVDATRLLRQKYACDIAIVALTANAVEDQKDQAMEAGCTEFITKPILREHLYETCRHFLMTTTTTTTSQTTR